MKSQHWIDKQNKEQKLLSDTATKLAAKVIRFKEKFYDTMTIEDKEHCNQAILSLKVIGK